MVCCRYFDACVRVIRFLYRHWKKSMRMYTIKFTSDASENEVATDCFAIHHLNKKCSLFVPKSYSRIMNSKPIYWYLITKTFTAVYNYVDTAISILLHLIRFCSYLFYRIWSIFKCLSSRINEKKVFFVFFFKFWCLKMVLFVQATKLKLLAAYIDIYLSLDIVGFY